MKKQFGFSNTKHFLDVTQRHSHGLVLLTFRIEVYPILKMVPVASLVVHPSQGIAKQLPLPLVRTAGALIISRSRQKFHKTVFGEVVKQPLPSDPCPKAMRDHTMSVTGNGLKMQQRMRHSDSFFLIILLLLYRISHSPSTVKPLFFSKKDRTIVISCGHGLTTRYRSVLDFPR